MSASCLLSDIYRAAQPAKPTSTRTQPSQPVVTCSRAVTFMSDPELEAIRRARLAELRGNTPGGMNGGTAMPTSLPNGMNASSLTGGDAEKDEKRAQQEEMKRQLLTQILDTEARERLSRIALVKPQKASAISDILVQMARTGQVRQRVTEDQLISLLDQVDQANTQESTGKITVTRKKTFDDSDDDWDL